MVNQNSLLYHLYLDRWPALDGEGIISKSFLLSVQQMTELAMDPDLRVCGFHLGLHEKWDYLDNSGKSTVLRQKHKNLLRIGGDLGFEMLTAGPMLTKAHGPKARGIRIPINIETRFDNSFERGLPENGRIWFTRTADRLKSLEDYDLARLNVECEARGTLYLNATNGIHISKEALNPGLNFVEYIKLPGVHLVDVLAIMSNGSAVTISSIEINSPRENELDAERFWVGNKETSFYRCSGRMADLSDWGNVCKDMEKIRDYPINDPILGIPEPIILCVTDEINCPVGHGARFKLMYPGGWPEAYARYLDAFVRVCSLFRSKPPWMFHCDPRTNRQLELRQNRTCAPVPQDLSADYIDYLQPETMPMTLVLWGETNRQDFWEAQFHHTAEFSDRVIGVYPGFKADPIFSAMQALGLDKHKFKYGVFGWSAQKSKMRSTLMEVQSHLEL